MTFRWFRHGTVTIFIFFITFLCLFWEQRRLTLTTSRGHRKAPFGGFRTGKRNHTTSSGDRCHGPVDPPSVQAPDPNQWQTVVPSDYYVYSTFADGRPGNETVVRIFGLMRLDLHLNPRVGEQLWCQIWLDGGGQPLTRKSTHAVQGHAYAEKYVSVEWTCPLSIQMADLTHISVSLVVNDSCSTSNNLMSAHKLVPKETHDRLFTVCLAGALKNDYSKYHQLVEWVEVNKMFGAENFVLYNANSSEILEPFVRHYVSENAMEIIPWNLPDIGNVEDFHLIWNYGQVTIINDCIFRNMFVAKYVVSVDLDEIIVPYGESDTWIDMMNSVPCGDMPIFIVRNAFFGIGANWNSSGIYKNDKVVQNILHLKTLTMTKQDAYINRFPKRSKFITKPDVVSLAGIHNVKGMFGKRNRNPYVCEIQLPFGRLHHYRDPRWDDIEPVDNTYMYKYADEIIRRTKLVHQRVSGLILE